MPSVKQQEPWLKAEALSQSLHFSSWIPSVQMHSQRRCTLHTQHCQEDTYQAMQLGKHRWAQKPTLCHPDAQEIWQFSDQTRCSPWVFPLFPSSSQTKQMNIQTRGSRGNVPGHPEPRPKPNQWEIPARTQGPTQNSNYTRVGTKPSTTRACQSNLPKSAAKAPRQILPAFGSS